MRRARLLLAFASAAALVAFVSLSASPPSALPAVVGPAAVPTDVPADPFPLRRQFLPDDQLDRLTTDPRGPLRKLPKGEFEGKVRAASEAQQLARTPPLVVSSAYQGRYEPGRITGTGEWTVANTGGRPALVPLDALRLAVTEITPAKDRTAILFRGKPGGKELPGTFLWVGGERETTATLGWSARGVEELDEERFDLGVPAAAIATLALTLPADRLPVLSTAGGKRIDATGPYPGTADSERVWKWAFGGLSNLTLAVRAADTPGAAVIAGRTATVELLPGEVRSGFDFSLDSPRGLIREAAFEVDGGVKISGVSGDGVEGWKQEPVERLTVKFREPSASVKLRVTTVAELPTGAVEWACPGVRAAGTLPGVDVIDVTVSPELKLDGWTAGDYRPAVGGTSTRGTKLQFTGTLTPADTPRRPPTIRVRSAGPEVATDEALVWRVEPGRTRLSAAVTLKVVRGPLPHLAVRTAPGYTLESAALVPEDPAVAFGPLPGTPDVWVVEPSRAIPTGGTTEVRLEFRGPPGPPAPDPGDPSPAAVPIPFPVFTPVGAVERQGTLTVVGERVQATARTVLPVAVAPAGGSVVAYRGKEPAGVGLFAPHPTAVEVDAVRLAVVGRTCEATIVGRAEDGPVGSLTVFVPHPDGRVKAAGAEAVPLPAVGLVPLLTAGSGWDAIATAGLVPEGRYWRVTFPQPKRGPFELTVGYPTPPVADGRLDLPLPVVGGGRGDYGVELSKDLAAVYHPDGPSADFPPRVFLEPLAAPPQEPPPTGEWLLADVRQVNRVDGDGGLHVTLTGRVLSAVGHALDVTLPPGAVGESVRVNGRWVTAVDGEQLRVPLPEPTAGGVLFEVRYRLPSPPPGPLTEYVSPPPGLPAGTGVRVRWEFDGGWAPWPSLAELDGCDGRQRVRVVREPVLRGVGFGLGGLVLAVGVALVLRGGRVRTGVLALVVGGCGAAAWVVSDGWRVLLHPPLFAGLAVLALTAFARSRTAPPAARRASTRVLSAAVLFGTAAVVGPAQPGGEPAVVYVVGSDAQAVYAPPAVLDKLDALAAPTLPDVIVTRAAYDGRADESGATFDATFTLFCPRDGDHPFALPLAGVRLEAMTLDKADPFPDASKPDRYGVVVRGKGPHTLTARFAVTPTLTGGEREARFGGPEVPVSRVTFDAGAKGRQPDVPTRRGGQTVSERVATADHGAGRAVAVRWREPTADGGKMTVSVREAAVWDATDTADAGVWAAFAFRVDAGAVERFALDVPAGLVPTRVLVRPLDGRAGVGLRGWATGPGADGDTRMDVRLQQPTDGRVLVVLRAVPAKPLTAAPVLRFPRAAEVPDADRESVYAVRFGGVAAGGVVVGGAIDFPSDAITKDFPTVAEFGFDKQPPARVVKRAANANTELRPTLAPAQAFVATGAEVAFTLGGWAEVDGAVRTGAKESGFVEFTVPEAIEVKEVRAAGLAGWGRTGAKVQAWLKQPAADVLVRWSGVLPVTGELPLPRWGSTLSPAEPTTVRVRAAEGYAVRPVQTDGLKAKPPAVERELVFTAEGQPPPPKFEVTPLPRAGDTRPAPPLPLPSPPPAPPPAPESTVNPVSPASPPANPWPIVWAVVWVAGVLAAVLLPGRWRPERVTAAGVLGVLAAGVGSPLGWGFAAVAGVGLAWRGWRVVRHLL